MSTLRIRPLTRLLTLQILLCFGLLVALPRLAAADTKVGAVFSTYQGAWQSYLRFYNAGDTAGSAVVQLQDFSTGQTLGQWTSPPIAAGAEQQFDITMVESALGPGTRPYYYTISVQTPFPGYFQHVLWRSADGTLTNLSTCSSGVTAAGTTLVGVHSSLLNGGYPSTVVVNNTGAQASTAALALYDARDGTKLGVYTTPVIPAGGAQAIALVTMELAIGRTPSAGMYHYVIKADIPFTGFFEHLVNNLQAGVTTDMTTECAMGAVPVASASLPLRVGAVFSTAQLNSRSYLRFINTGSSAGTAAVTLRDQASGQVYGTWTSPPINPGAEQQFAIDQLESVVLGGAAKPPYYTITIASSMHGYFQHVLWRVADGTLTNLSTCGAGVTADTRQLTGVHSSLLGKSYPSGIVITNLGAATPVTIGVYDARDGTKLGAYTTDPIPAGGQFMAASASLEVVINKAPTAGMYHYVVKIESPFTGFVQHLVNNLQAGVVTDMTTACSMN